MSEEIQVNETAPAAKKCGCGRSPLGVCIGWHSLGEDEFRQALAVYESNVIPKNDLI